MMNIHLLCIATQPVIVHSSGSSPPVLPRLDGVSSIYGEAQPDVKVVLGDVLDADLFEIVHSPAEEELCVPSFHLPFSTFIFFIFFSFLMQRFACSIIFACCQQFLLLQAALSVIF